MPTLAADNSLPIEMSSSRTRNALSSLAIVVWVALGVMSVQKLSALEIANSAGLLVATLITLVAVGIKRTSERPAARLWTVTLFVFAMLTLSPAFQRTTTVQSFREWDRFTQVIAFIPIALMALLWMARRPVAPRQNDDITSARIEEFLQKASTRIQLIPIAMLITAAGLGLSGQPMGAIVPRAGFLAALFVFALPSLLQFSTSAGGVRMLHGALATGLLITSGIGASRYFELRGKVSEVGALLAKDNTTEAQKITEDLTRMNEVLQSRSSILEVETQWALFHERKEEYESSLVHWRRIADMHGQEPGEMQPVRRVLCKMGDSLTAWRRLIYQGFAAINDPEIVPGIKSLGDKPGSDLRAKVLSALLAWEQNEPEAERKRRLEEVRKVVPNEPSSNNLLRRMGAKIPDAPLWLPAELIVGKKMTTTSLLGDVDELGEVQTLVVLDEGHWELALNARGTPLQEEWPIIRLELNGQEIARTQVTHDQNRDVPFTFDVNRGDIYRIKVVLENQQEMLVQGHITRRGLTINGMTFRRAKE